MRSLLVPPTAIWRGTRQIDDFGAGGFGAPRVRNGRNYPHKGLDLLAEPDDSIVAPFEGDIYATPGWAYSGGEGGLRTIHLRDATWRCTLMYVKPLATLDEKRVVAGEPIGVAQDVAGYHMTKSGDGRKMSNHVHFELYELVDKIWRLRDPSKYLSVPSPS